jgi:hypothetical protein
MPVNINLWLYKSIPPSDGNEVEIIIHKFTFTSDNCPETYEPNDSSARSYTLFSGPLSQTSLSKSVSSVISAGSDQDWFKVPIDWTGNLKIDLTNLPKDYDMELYPSSGLAGGAIGESYNTGTLPESISYNYNTPQSTSLYVKVYPKDNTQFTPCNPYSLTVSWTPSGAGCSAPSNNLCGNAVELTPSSSCNYIYGTTCSATHTNPTNIPTCIVSPEDALDVWYKFTATQTSAKVQVQGGNNFDPIVQVLSNVVCASSYTQIACANSTGSGAVETVPLSNLTVGHTYWIRVYNNAGLSGTDFDICVANESCTKPAKPVITGNNKICQGDNDVLTVETCDGCRYDWSDGAQGFSNLVSPAATTTYTEITSNSCGSSPADAFILKVGPAPAGTITGTDHPAYGTKYHYSIDAVEDATSYVWQTLGHGADVTNTTTTNPYIDITWTNDNFSDDVLFVIPQDPLCGQGKPTSLNITLPSVLAVKLNSFEVVKKGETSLLKWKMEKEDGVSSYVIERSGDGKQFVQIISIKAKNSNLEDIYSYIDNSPLNGKNYYRLKIVSNDGRFSFSEVRQAEYNLTLQVDIFPNPIKNNTINVIIKSSTSCTAELSITNNEGKMLATSKLFISQGSFTKELNIRHIANGVYYLKIITDAGIIQKKFIKMN